MNGIQINKEEFMKMPVKEQNLVLFNNTEELKELVRGYRFHQRIQYVWLAVLTIAVGAGKYIGVI